MAQRTSREDQIDQRYRDRFNPDQSHQLRQLEHSYQNSLGQDDIDRGIDDAAKYANDPENSSQNIDDARNSERSSSRESGWNTNIKGSEKQPTTLGGRARQVVGAIKGRKGATGGVIGIILAFLGIGGGLLSPGIALIHVKEVVENKIDTMAAAIDVRAQRVISARMANKSVKGKCNGMVKINCRFRTFSDTQLKDLKARGITIVDANGKEIKGSQKPNGKTRMKMADGKTYKASQFNKQLRRDPVLRNSLRTVYPTRFAVWNDKVAGKFMKTKRIVKNPKWTKKDSGGDVKKNKTQVVKNIQENQTAGETLELDTGEYKSNIEDGTKDVEKNIKDGKPIAATNSNASEVLNNKEVTPKQGKFKAFLKGVGGFFNPAEAVVGVCLFYRYADTVVTASKVALVAQQMRYATQFLSTADKIKAGEATPNDVSSAMNILQTKNKFGSDFGDSTGFHYAQYSKPTNEPISAMIAGSSMLVFLSNVMNQLHKIPQSQEACGLISSAPGQIIGAVAGLTIDVVSGLVTGGTSTAVIHGIKEAGEKGAELTVRKIVRETAEKAARKVSESVAEKSSRDALKGALKSGGARIAKLGTQATGLFLMSYLLERYFTDFAVKALTGTAYNGDMNGVDAMDTVTSGAAAMNNGVAQSRGLTALSQTDAIAYQDFKTNATNQYIADMRQQANPFDFNNPYSLGNSVGFSLGTFVSTINIFGNTSSVMTLPSTVLSSIFNPSLLSSPASAASTKADQQALMDECKDIDANQKGSIATDPFCNPIYGVTDIHALQNAEPDDIAQYMLDHGYIDNEGEPKGDYANYSKTCFVDSTNKVLSSSIDKESQLDSKCYKRPSDIDQTTYTYFHLYQMDKNIIDQMDEPYVDDGGSDPSSSDGDTETVTGDTKKLAQDVLDLKKAGKIAFPYHGADAQATFEELAAGKKAHVNGSTATNKSTDVDPAILKFIVDLANKTSKPLQINALTNRTHMKGSKHYLGRAVDFGCSISNLQATADPIGKKYNIGRNRENCSANAHWHYEVGR